ncbi:MAG: YdgA family protein [Gammaproteobacteria bacterium]|nr:YdgA family protein [Gammaproteobacteria bacterium]
MKRLRDYLLEIILAVVSLSLLLLMLAPYWVGYTMQPEYERVIRSFSDNSGFSYEVISYDRQWFTTDAVLLVKSASNQTLAYMKHQIVHGPVYFGLLLQGRSPWVNMVIKASWLPAEINQQVLPRFLLPDQPIKLFAVIQHNNDAELSLTIPAIEGYHNDVKYKADAIDVSLKYRSDNSLLLGELKLPAFLMTNHQSLEADKIILSFNQKYSDQSFSGDIVLSLDSLRFILNNDMVDIKQLSSRIINSSEISGLSLALDLNVSRINVLNEQLNSLTVGAGVNGFNADGLHFDKQVLDPGFLSGLEFQTINIKPLSFFTEHGALVADLTLSNLLNRPFSLDSGFNENEPVFNLDISIDLFKRLFNLFASNLQQPVHDSRFFLNTMISLNYIEKNQEKIRIRLSNKHDKIVINDNFVNFYDLRSHFLSALSLK